ncbi:5'-nucleotidase C-terminal domain-containing protein [uncultured Eudoraea sp.]|uniref:5'-nucleotidase C-terminal domain-containing protein n=1 Tax=uncultured Eudoraea sp. TaxID=1035614 RepID=UPI0026298066|nr:5'-nucleotidase [uncultured Eudoraea sp.]
MILKIQHFVIFVTIACLYACNDAPKKLSKISGKQLPITDSINVTDSIDIFVAPYRKRVNEVLDSTLAFAPSQITKKDGKYNTSAGNLMADIMLSEANPVFKSRTGHEIDFVISNYGGIRSIISEGKVSARTAYEVMPFDNSIVVVAIKGKSVRDLISFLINAKNPHPIAGIQIILNNNETLKDVNIQGLPFDENRTYYVATSNYLADGGDEMGFFRDGLNTVDLNYLIRNAMIDYFKKVDTLTAKVDDRFIKIE